MAMQSKRDYESADKAYRYRRKSRTNRGRRETEYRHVQACESERRQLAALRRACDPREYAHQ